MQRGQFRYGNDQQKNRCTACGILLKPDFGTVFTMDYLDNGIVIKDGNGQVIYKKIADEQMEQKIEAYIGENPESASVLNKEYILKRSVDGKSRLENLLFY